MSTSGAGRTAALLALAVAAVGVALLLMGQGEGGGYTVTGEFENASQLVEGNQVVIGGQAVGSVEEIELGPSGQALVSFSVDSEFAPLHRGTVATVRSYSLSGIANRQVQLTPPAEGQAGEEIPDGGVLGQSETVSEVDLDEIFNTLDDKTVKSLKKVIRGFEISYDGVGEQANRGFKYLNPLLYNGRRFFGELNRDERALEQLVVDGARLTGALAERAPDISLLIGNLNRMMGAIASRKEELARSIALLPDFMRSANTTFVNLRATLDDVTPLVEASKPAAVALQDFLPELRGALANAVPTIEGLDDVVLRSGKANDLVDLNRLQVPVTDAAIGSGAPDCGEDPQADFESASDEDFTQGAFGESVCSLRNGLPGLAFFRAYTPELISWFDGFSHSGTVDAMGGVGRIDTILNTFTVSPITGAPFIGSPPEPLSDPARSALVITDQLNKCPGANERPLGAADPADTSVPFFEDGSSEFTNPVPCDPEQVQPGP